MKIVNICVVLVFLLVAATATQAADECLDVSAARYLVNQALNSQFPDPQTVSAALDTAQALTNILGADSSTFALNLFVGYDSNHYISVQSCSYSALACYYTNSPYFVTIAGYGDTIQRYYAVNNGTVSRTAVSQTGDNYVVTSRPWYNANGFTATYAFANLQTTGRTYEITQSGTGAHIASDRLNYEPCSGSLANSPTILAARALAAYNSLTPYAQTTSRTQVATLLNQLSSQLNQFQTSSNGLASLGAGFNSGNFYSVTDCNALSSSGRSQECSSSRYYGEVVNQAIFGNSNLQVYNFQTGTYRDSGNNFQTTQRPWFVTRDGFTDPYAFQTGTGSVVARSYASSFTGGVAYADPSVNQDSSSCATPSPSPSTSGNNNNKDSDVTINFYFADMLNGISN